MPQFNLLTAISYQKANNYQLLRRSFILTMLIFFMSVYFLHVWLHQQINSLSNKIVNPLKSSNIQAQPQTFYPLWRILQQTSAAVCLTELKLESGQLLVEGQAKTAPFFNRFYSKMQNQFSELVIANYKTKPVRFTLMIPTEEQEY